RPPCFARSSAVPIVYCIELKAVIVISPGACRPRWDDYVQSGTMCGLDGVISRLLTERLIDHGRTGGAGRDFRRVSRTPATQSAPPANARAGGASSSTSQAITAVISGTRNVVIA